MKIYYFYLHYFLHWLFSPLHTTNSPVCRGFESHPRQLIFSRKSDCLGCAVFVCLTLLASFFLPSHLSFKNMYILCISLLNYSCMHIHIMRVVVDEFK